MIREYEKDENFKQNSDVYELAEGIWIDLAAMKEKRGRKEERKWSEIIQILITIISKLKT